MKWPHDALAVFDRLIALVPDKAEAHYFRARTMVDMDMLEEALGAYKTALDLEPNAPDYLTDIAATYLYA
jgi:cytochrome c-type biogenesis protein CcmH/NrfG